MPEAIFNTSVYFKNTYEDAWITDPVAREMILDVDKSVVLDSAVSISAQGKSNIFTGIVNHLNEKILVIADGAAFGFFEILISS